MYSQLCSFFSFSGGFFLCFALYMYSTYVFNTKSWVAPIGGASAPWVLPVTPYKCFSYVIMICTCILDSVCLVMTNKLLIN